MEKKKTLPNQRKLKCLRPTPPYLTSVQDAEEMQEHLIRMSTPEYKLVDYGKAANVTLGFYACKRDIKKVTQATPVHKHDPSLEKVNPEAVFSVSSRLN